MISVRVENRKATAVPLTAVTTGAVGIPVLFDFSSDWDGLAKVAVFKAGNVEPVEQAILENQCTCPVEPLATENLYETLWIGIQGANAAGTIVIPTIWANAGVIQLGTESSALDPAQPTPSWAAQVQQAAEEALTIANTIQNRADSGEFNGEDGADGTNGTDGRDGVDGVSPTVTVVDISGGHRVTITGAAGVAAFDVMDGEDGAAGADGADGMDGMPGADGYSPTIRVTEIANGHRVTITDAAGPKSFDVLNGQDGLQGTQGETGATGATGNGVRTVYPNGGGVIDGRHYTEYLMVFTDGTTYAFTIPDGKDGKDGMDGTDVMRMSIDGNGHLIYTYDEHVAADFHLDSDGHLIVEEAA